MTKSIDRSLVLRHAWYFARHTAAATGTPVRSRIGDAMRDAWALAKSAAAAVAATVPQPAQQQQACAAPAPLSRDELLSRIRNNDRQYAEVAAEIERRRAVNGSSSRLDAWLLDGPRASGAILREQLAELDRVAMENPPTRGYRVVKAWIDDADQFQTRSLPLIFARAEDATGEIVSLLGGRDPATYSAAEREAGALLTMEEVGPAPAMVAQPVQQQQACAASTGRAWVDKWTRLPSRVYGDSLLGAISAEEATVVYRSDWYRQRALPVVRVEGERLALLGWAENEAAAAAVGAEWEHRSDVAVRVLGPDGPVAFALLGTGGDDDGLRLFQPRITAVDGDGGGVDECDERAVRWTVGDGFWRWTFDGHNPACTFARLCEGFGFVPRFEDEPARGEPAAPAPAGSAGFMIVKRWRDAQGNPCEQAFPVVFVLEDRAATTVAALRAGGYPDFYGTADRERGATLDVEAVTVPAA